MRRSFFKTFIAFVSIIAAKTGFAEVDFGSEVASSIGKNIVTLIGSENCGRIYLVPVKGKSNFLSGQDYDYLESVVKEKISQSGCVLVDRDHGELIEEELKRQASGLVNPEKTVELGQQVGANQLVLAEFSEKQEGGDSTGDGTKITILESVKVVDLKTATARVKTDRLTYVKHVTFHHNTFLTTTGVTLSALGAISWIAGETYFTKKYTNEYAAYKAAKTTAEAASLHKSTSEASTRVYIADGAGALSLSLGLWLLYEVYKGQGSPVASYEKVSFQVTPGADSLRIAFSYSL